MNISEILSASPLCTDLQKPAIEQLTNCTEIKEFHKNETIFNEGEKSEHFYQVISGKVSIERKIGHKDNAFSKQVFLARKNNIFGEMSFIDKRNRTATARTKTSVKLLQFSTPQLDEMICADYELGFIIMRNLSQILSDRLLHMNKQWLKSTLSKEILLEF